MDTLELKNRIKNYLDYADERILKILNAIIDAESKESLSEKEKEILDQRLKLHKESPESGVLWEDLEEKLLKKYGV
ncbi:MAG: addiction module family protein [Flavobacteriaceae bacterium]